MNLKNMLHICAVILLVFLESSALDAATSTHTETENEPGTKEITAKGKDVQAEGLLHDIDTHETDPVKARWIAIKKLVVGDKDGSDGDVYALLTEEVSVECLRKPNPETSEKYPSENPKWTISSPEGSNINSLAQFNGKRKAAFTPDKPGSYTVTASCGSSSDEIVIIAIAKLVQFNAKSDRFPKCVGSNISVEDDFALITDPVGYKNDVIVTGVNTTVPQGSSGKVAKTATATLGNQTINAQYVIIAEETTEACDAIHPITVNATLASAFYVQTSYMVARYEWSLQNVNITGTSVPTYSGESTGWGPCGGTTGVGTKKTVNYAVNAGVSIGNLVKATIGGSFNYSTTRSVTFSATAMQNFKQNLKAWGQPIDLTAATNSATVSKYVYSWLEGWTFITTYQDQFNETFSGGFDAEQQTCIKCCDIQ